MIYDRIKGIDKNWSRITLGCWQIAPSGGWGDICPPEDAERVVRTALEHGITAFDTAEGYGDGESERRLGKALGSKKDSAIVGSRKPEQVHEFARSSDLKLGPDQLQRLTTASDQFPMVKKGH